MSLFDRSDHGPLTRPPWDEDSIRLAPDEILDEGSGSSALECFAVRALEQVAASESRYSRLTGDIGVALYAYACLEGWQGVPILDVL